jgi:serine/threonine-protein kinase HipA
MKFSSVQEIIISLKFGDSPISVGRLAARERQIYFEYDASFLKRGLNISPFHLPLKPGIVSFEKTLFEGLPGVFNDSLPDGWGRLLLDRCMRQQGILPSQLEPLDRLAAVGKHGMGALTYEPDHSMEDLGGIVDLDTIASYSKNVLEGEADSVLRELLILNGSSAGARPKALIGLDSGHQSIIHGIDTLPEGYDHWLVKFSNASDGDDAGAIEYVYSLMARAAGLPMTETCLFPARRGPGYFAIKRFDRDGERHIHTHTACGLFHSNFRAPCLDYEDLIAWTVSITRDIREGEKMFQLGVFNVLAYNRDDHSKNFSYLMDEQGTWRLSPPYDLTFSSGAGGEQSTMVMGEGKSPGPEHLMKLAQVSRLDKKRVGEIIEQTKYALSRWKQLATEHGVSKENIALIGKRIGL